MRAILTYHSVDTTGSPISVSPREFSTHVKWIASGAVRVVPLQELSQIPERTDALALTFDDGLQSAIEIAGPTLRDHALPATFFIPTAHVGGDNRWGGGDDASIPVMPVADWDTLGRLADEGFEIGAHTRTHPRLPMCDDAQLTDELEGAIEDIVTHIGHTPRSFAYPYGTIDDRVRRAVTRRYAIGCTTELRVLQNTDPRECLPRLDAWYLRQPGRLQAWGSLRFSGYLGMRRVARRLRATWS